MFCTIKIHDFWGDLTDMLARTQSLTALSERTWMSLMKPPKLSLAGINREGLPSRGGGIPSQEFAPAVLKQQRRSDKKYKTHDSKPTVI